MGRPGPLQIGIAIPAETKRHLFPFSPGEVGGMTRAQVTAQAVGMQGSQQYTNLGEIDGDTLLQLGNFAIAPSFTIFLRQLSHPEQQIDKADVAFFPEEFGGEQVHLADEVATVGAHTFFPSDIGKKRDIPVFHLHLQLHPFVPFLTFRNPQPRHILLP